MTVAFITLAFAAGVAVGVLFDDAWDLYRSSRKEKPVRRLRPPSYRQVVGALLAVGIALQLVVGVLLILTRASAERYAACTARWQQQFSEAYTPRANASTEVGKALDDIIVAVGKDDPASFNKAVDRYLAVRAQQDRDRTQNPYPPLPATLCGEAPTVTR